MTKFDDTLQFKIDTEAKLAFQRAVDEEGLTVSIVCRRFIRDYLRGRVFLATVPENGNTPKETESVAA